MTNHLHLLACPAEGKDLSDILRDFKKFTARQILLALKEKKVNESRARAFMHSFGYHGEHNMRNDVFQFWQQGNHAIHARSPAFCEQKLAYIHNNPVRAGFVDEPWQYRYSSARDYMTGRKGLVDVELLR